VISYHVLPADMRQLGLVSVASRGTAAGEGEQWSRK